MLGEKEGGTDRDTPISSVGTEEKGVRWNRPESSNSSNGRSQERRKREKRRKNLADPWTPLRVIARLVERKKSFVTLLESTPARGKEGEERRKGRR